MSVLKIWDGSQWVEVGGTGPVDASPVDSSLNPITSNWAFDHEASQVSALAGKEPADATILKAAAIGVSVQAYAANLTAWAGKTAPSGAVVGTTDTQTLTNKTLTQPKETAQTTITTGVSSIDWSAGHVIIDYAGNTNISSGGFTNVPSGGAAYLHILFKHNGGVRTLTLPSTVKSTITLAGTSGNWDRIVLMTYDGGTNIYGAVVESK